MTFEDFMSARDLKTGETFQDFAQRTGMKPSDIQAGYRWQQRVERMKAKQSDQPKRQPEVA